MVSGRIVIGLVGLSAFFPLTCSATFAATMRADVINPAAKLALSDLTLVDPLGYDCIREEDIDLAFHATGKGMRLPRTCLPDPCEAALTPVQLAGLIGRDPYQREWDDYFSRYADVCRKEVVPFVTAPDAAGPVQDAVAFWAPLAARYPATAPIRSNLPNVSGFANAGWPSTSTAGPGPSGTSPGPNIIIPDDKPFETPDDGPKDSPDPDDPLNNPEPEVPPSTPLPVVPLPATWMLLLTGTLCLWLRRRFGSA